MSNTITREQGNFSTIPNQLLNDPLISLTAKGLYVFMRGKPPLWNFTIRSMAKQLKEGETAIGSALKELKDSGWVSYTKHSNGKGVYHLLWSAHPEHENPNHENPNQGNPMKGKPQRISKKEPIVRNNNSNKDVTYSDKSLRARAVEPVSLKSKITARELILEFGVSEQIANEYLVVRGKAPLTPTALKLILNEADKIGWSLQQALTACCENSWRGFRADWIKNQQQRLGSQNNEGFKTAQASIDRLNDTSWAK